MWGWNYFCNCPVTLKIFQNKFFFNEKKSSWQKKGLMVRFMPGDGAKLSVEMWMGSDFEDQVVKTSHFKD